MGRNRPDAQRWAPAPRGTRVRLEPDSGRSPTFSPSSVPQTLVLPFLGSSSRSSLAPSLKHLPDPASEAAPVEGSEEAWGTPQCQPQHPFLRSTNASTFRPVSSQHSQPHPNPWPLSSSIPSRYTEQTDWDKKHLIGGLGAQHCPSRPIMQPYVQWALGRPWDIAEGASWQQTGQCGLNPPLMGEKWGRCQWVG